jgi:hypothetical protein
LRPGFQRFLIAVAVTFVVVLSHAASAEDAPKAATYMVYDGERPVLKVIDRPGTLTSTALPKPGAKPLRHPFLTASALTPDKESRLRQILDASVNTIDFLKNLRQAGYVVIAE